jgi:hypothetical protein
MLTGQHLYEQYLGAADSLVAPFRPLYICATCSSVMCSYMAVSIVLMQSYSLLGTISWFSLCFLICLSRSFEINVVDLEISGISIVTNVTCKLENW